MRLTARVDYALRALIELSREDEGVWLTSEELATREDISQRFLEQILRDLRRLGAVESRRGPEGGHRLTPMGTDMSVADVIRAVEGPLSSVRGLRPEELEYSPGVSVLRDLWLALRHSERQILEATRIRDLRSGELPEVARRHL